MSPPRQDGALAFLALAVAVIAVSLAAPLVRAAEPAPALTVAAVRIALAGVILAAIAGRRGLALVWSLPRRQRLRIAIAGALLGAHFATWITSLYFTSTAAAVTLVATQPVFAAVLGYLIAGDGVRRREIVGMVVAGGGCVILAGGDLSATPGALIGDALALVGAATAAGYLAIGRSLRAELPLTPYLAAVHLIAGAGLVCAALASGAQWAGFSAIDYAAMVAGALIPSLLGHTLLNWSVRRAPTHLVSLAILGEPVGATALSWLIFGEAVPTYAAAGGAVILAGIALGFIRDRLAPPAV